MFRGVPRHLLGLILGVAFVLGISTSLGARVALADVVAIEGTTLDKPSLTLKVGVPEKLTATVLPENATNKQIQWYTASSYIEFYADEACTVKVEKIRMWITERSTSWLNITRTVNQAVMSVVRVPQGSICRNRIYGRED